MQRLLISSMVLSAATSCGCYSNASDIPPLKSRSDNERIVYRIKELGGVAELYNKDFLKHYNLPMSLNRRIVSIYLARVDLTDVSLESLIPYHSVKSVDLTGAEVRDDQIHCLRQCVRLDTLSLDSTGITDEAMKYVGQIPTLKLLYLDRCNISDGGLHYLETCTTLKELAIVDTHVTREGIKCLQQKLPALEVNRWSRVPSEEIRRALANLERSGARVVGAPTTRPPRNYRYSISFSEEWEDSPDGIDWLKSAATEKTHIWFHSPLPDLFSRLDNVKHILSLSLTQKAAVRDGDLQVLENVHEIEMIRLYGRNVTDVGIGHLTKVKGLKELGLNEMTVTTPIVSKLADCEMLEKLTFSFCDLDYRRLDPFAQSPSLKELNLDTCKNVSSEAVRDLRARRPELKVTLLKDGQPVLDIDP